MNLKQSFRIIDARRGGVKKPSRIRDNGWRPHSGRQVYQVGRDLHFEKESTDRDEAIAYARRLHEDTRDRTYVKYGYESDWGLGQEMVWNSDTDYVGDSRKVRDMAVRDMAVRNEEAIYNAAAARNSGFVANNPWIYNLTADPNAQAVKNAIDFFDTVEYLVQQGYNYWVSSAIDACREATDLGLDRSKRTFYIWGYKREGAGSGTRTENSMRVEYSPDKLQLRLLDYYAAIGGDASNEEMGEFIKVFNTLTYTHDEDPDERIIEFTEQFFGMVEGEFGSSEYGTDEVAQ